jgi:curli production assembly/transport component CsgF
MKLVAFSAAVVICAQISCGAAFAGPLVYTPINPSFGGDPLNSSHLMGLASAQRTATAYDADTGNGGGGGGGDGKTPGSSDADLFVRQLQGRLMSALASQVTEAIFGQNPANQGTVIFGDTTVTFNRDEINGYIELTIDDITGSTVIKVPLLITN